MFKYIYSLVFILSIHTLSLACEIDKLADEIANGLFSGCPIARTKVQDFFRELEAQKKKSHSLVPSHEEDSDSGASISSISSEEFIEGMEEAFDSEIDPRDKSDKQISVRKEFIANIRELSPTVDSDVFKEGLIMVSNTLFQ
jgi:hypothetical protein